MFDIIDKTFGNIVLKLESLPILEYVQDLVAVAIKVSLKLLFFGQKLKEGFGFVRRQQTNGSSTIDPNLFG